VINDKLKQLFLENSELVTETGCRIWTGYTNADGYGRFWFHGKLCLVHRIVYTVFYGEVASSLHILHRCDVPACINELHLYIGTDLDNHNDSIKRGRSARGEKNGKVKLTELQVKEIKQKLKAGHHYKVLAEQYKVHFNTIQAIKHGRMWKWL